MTEKSRDASLSTADSVEQKKCSEKAGAAIFSLGYILLVLLPIIVLVLVPGYLLQTGQGGEVLANASRVRSPEFIVCVAIPFLFLMFCSAARILISALWRLSLTEWCKEWLTKSHHIVACGFGFVATLGALLPFYTYRREYGLAAMFDQGFVGRVYYDVGVVLILLLCVCVYTDWRIQAGSARSRWVINIGSRVVYIGTAVLVYVMAERMYAISEFAKSLRIEKELEAIAFLAAVLVVSIIVHPINGTRRAVPRAVPDWAGVRQWARIYFHDEWHVVALATLILILFARYPSEVGLLLGSLLVLIAGIGAWVVLLSVVWAAALVTRNRGPKAVSLGIAVSALLFISARNTEGDAVNNPIGWATATLNQARTPASTVAEDYASWSKSDAGSSAPPIIVLAEGGGIRASYWAAASLQALSQPSVNLISNMYAVIGVSGGALGTAAFMANYAAVGKAAAEDPAFFRPIFNLPAIAGNRAKEQLSVDFLGPWLARMLSTELLQKVLPWRVFGSKGQTLQDAWYESLTCSQKMFDVYRSNADKAICNGTGAVLKSSLTDFPLTLGSQRLPRLFFVATHVESGERVLFTSAYLAPGEFSNAIMADTVTPGTISMIAAAHASARFPLVSPPGKFVGDDGRVMGHIVDGGYVDNSGAQTALDLVSAISRSGAENFRPIIIDLVNDPDGRSAINSFSRTAYHTGELETFAAAVDNSNQSRGYFIKKVLLDEVCRLGGGYVSLRVQKKMDGPIGLGWTLSQYAALALNDAMERERSAFVRDRHAVGTPEQSAQRLVAMAQQNCHVPRPPF